MTEPVRGRGFHDGERAVQRQAGVVLDAARLERMLDPAELSTGVTRFLADQTFLSITARDRNGILWVSPLTGRPGFVEVNSTSTLSIHAGPEPHDPLHDLDPEQPVGIIALDYARRRRFRLNGTLEAASATELSVRIDQAFGNCPQYIPPRESEPLDPAELELSVVGRGAQRFTSLTDGDRSQIALADSFILGTTHPDRGNDTSHRGGPAGFVRTAGNTLWWPDYVGNNMFNSFGNLRIDPEAALLFLDFAGREALHLSGTAELVTTEVGVPGDDGHTGRRVTFTTRQGARSRLSLR